MSDYYESPVMTRRWCPLCEPEVDPFTELVEEIRCDEHYPGREGALDNVVDQTSNLLSHEGGKDNAQWCAFLHRDAR